MVPSAFVALDVLPLTANGKVDRDSLPPPPRAPETSRDAPPQTQIERTICAIWAEELHCERVGIDENFFDLGGNSLSLVRVHLRLEQLLEQTIPVVELFRYPTVRALAVFLGERERRQSVVEKARERATRRREARP
jgi:acyl carrier protein